VAYIVDGDATDSEAKEHVACRLDDVIYHLVIYHVPFILTSSYLVTFPKTAAKLLLFFHSRKKLGNFLYCKSFFVKYSLQNPTFVPFVGLLFRLFLFLSYVFVKHSINTGLTQH